MTRALHASVPKSDEEPGDISGFQGVVECLGGMGNLMQSKMLTHYPGFMLFTHMVKRCSQSIRAGKLSREEEQSVKAILQGVFSSAIQAVGRMAFVGFAD